jgi:hypothetical protein
VPRRRRETAKRRRDMWISEFEFPRKSTAFAETNSAFGHEIRIEAGPIRIEAGPRIRR